jgi:hypothetical protein
VAARVFRQGAERQVSELSTDDEIGKGEAGEHRFGYPKSLDPLGCRTA